MDLTITLPIKTADNKYIPISRARKMYIDNNKNDKEQQGRTTRKTKARPRPTSSWSWFWSSFQNLQFCVF